VEKLLINTKQAIKLPNFDAPNNISALFPLAAALHKGDKEIFMYYWETLSYLWDEESLEGLIKILPHFSETAPLSEFIPMILKSRTLSVIFFSMTF
jgi:hypothetical protein